MSIALSDNTSEKLALEQERLQQQQENNESDMAAVKAEKEAKLLDIKIDKTK